MKVVALNGSPKSGGNTYFAIKAVLEELEEEGIETEILQVGNKEIHGCGACGSCGRNKNMKCAIDDVVNEYLPKMAEADGIIIASPVYYASMSGTLKSFLDRAFYVAGANGGLFRHKVGAAIAVSRRSGEVATFDNLNHYFTITEMFVASSNYWNVAHARNPREIQKDEEGLQTMRILGRNMAFLIKSINLNKENLPVKEPKIMTNFIR